MNFALGKSMSERNGTANVLAQITAFRELTEDYNSEVAENLTARNLQRNGIDASITDVKGWDKINNAALQGRLDIPAEVVIAEGKAAIAAGTSVDQAAQNTISRDEQTSDDSDSDDGDGDGSNDDGDVEDDLSEDDERSSIDDMYGYDDPDDNAEAALDDVLKNQENS